MELDGLLGAIIAAATVTPSGALMPGPLSLVAMMWGARASGWRSGLRVALGHMVVEMPYFFALLWFSASLLSLGGVAKAMVTISTGFIFYFAYLSMRDAVHGVNMNLDNGSASKLSDYGPVAAGIVLTGLNPYFLLWWLTAGLPIISRASSLGLSGQLIVYGVHVSYDYAWLALLAHLAFMGRGRLGGTGYRVLIGIIGTILAVFGIDMLLRTYIGYAVLPF